MQIENLHYLASLFAARDLQGLKCREGGFGFFVQNLQGCAKSDLEPVIKLRGLNLCNIILSFLDHQRLVSLAKHLDPFPAVLCRIDSTKSHSRTTHRNQGVTPTFLPISITFAPCFIPNDPTDTAMSLRDCPGTYH